MKKSFFLTYASKLKIFDLAKIFEKKLIFLLLNIAAIIWEFITLMRDYFVIILKY